MKLTNEQRDMLWGKRGPYSEASLKKQVRILDDRISRIFLEVEVNINPTTFKLVKKHRNDKEFKDDIIIQQFLDHADYRGQKFGYVSCAFSGEYIDKKVLKEAERSLKYSQEIIIKMHKFIINKMSEK